MEKKTEKPEHNSPSQKNGIIRIGYACLAVAVPDTDIRSCILRNANEARLLALIDHNLSALETMIDYNIRNGIKLYRISSDLIPFGSSVAIHLPWAEAFSERLAAIGLKVRDSGMRVSMHPGQYTVLNSPDSAIADRAVEDLCYHTRVLDSMGLDASHKIILHIGGAYGDKKFAAQRFVARFADMDTHIRRRIVLENDDSLFDIADVLETASTVGLPVVYDNLHNAVNSADSEKTDAYWIRECAGTWIESDGTQKVHYSQQHPNRKPGAHSESVMIDAFLDFFAGLGDLKPDIMLEVKDKNLSAIKCLLCTQNRGIGALEAEWARYKYSVLEKSPGTYNEIRAMLCDKSSYPAVPFYHMTEHALRQPRDMGHAANALQHVWGYLKDAATETEKKNFSIRLEAYSSGDAPLEELKRMLQRLAVKYRCGYLLDSYYFDIG